ncbi:Dfg10 [Kluyveromyces lactis]|nr:Dfg10 [Kluyveromyces lactis]
MDIFQIFLYSTFYVGILSVFVAEFYIPQLLKYGKTWEASNNFWYSLTCPKSNFGHFYLLSSIFSIYNLLWIRSLLTLSVFIHSVRRLYECYCVTKWGQSKIHLSHYLVGIWFYTTLNLGIMRYHGETQYSLISVILFIMSSLDQATNHDYLSKLRKYSQPSYGLFKYICSAHYFDELLIYTSFMLMDNGSRILLIHCILWILVNLGTSSYETGNWYLEKFGYRSRWYLIPYVF